MGEQRLLSNPIRERLVALVEARKVGHHLPDRALTASLRFLPAETRARLQDQIWRSSERYWIASETLSDVIWSVPARSAIVRATFRMRS